MSEPDLVSPWVPEARPRLLKAMGKAMEELAECVSSIARCVIQGVDECEPVTGKLNRVWLREEIADVRAMLAELECELGLTSDDNRVVRKRVAQQRWKDML